MDLRLYLLQRISAMVMVPPVFVHLGTMIYAIQGGLSADEILSRTQGSLFWMLFYGTFVAAAAVHAALGLRTIAREWLNLQRWPLSFLTWGVFGMFFYMGARAVTAVTQI